MAVILISLSFALWALLITEKLFNKFRNQLITAVIVFAVAIVAFAFEIRALGLTLIFALALLSIILAIANQK